MGNTELTVPESYVKLMFGSGDSEPDALDKAIRFEVFQANPNYVLSPEWVEFFRQGISIPEKGIRDSLQYAFDKDRKLKIRDFYRKLFDGMSKNFPGNLLENLRRISLEHVYPKDCGLVAIAACVRDFARPEVIEVAPQQNELLVSLKDINGKFSFNNRYPGLDYSWLRLE